MVLGAAEAPEFKPHQKRWWAIQPVALPAVPEVPDSAKAWLRNEIDAFVYEKLAAKNIQPNPRAARETFARRVTLDLTGVPPTPEELQTFAADTKPGAEERLVDRLLASPRYGERWGRHWLDVVRYSDSDGFKQDDTRPNMWRYRDWVIQSFNEDKPYDRFVKEQLAADELYPGDKQALVGLGFVRLFEDEYNQAHIRLRRQEMLNDLTDNTAYAFLGVTMACARCHDHKFDPLLHKDYYRLQSFFANVKIHDTALLDDDKRVAEYEAASAKYRAAAKPVLDKIAEFMAAPTAKFKKDRLERFPDDIQEILLKDKSAMTPLELNLYWKALPQVDVTEEETFTKLKAADKSKYLELQKELEPFAHLKPEPLRYAQVMQDQGVDAPPVHVLLNGALEAEAEQVQPGFLSILDPAPAKVTPLPELNSSGRRSALANWLADAKNPLSTRVIVNRVWQYHFGTGLVATPNDFGVMGQRPSNRELLDWLTAKFVTEDGWSLKKLHKRIVLSATYMQDSAYREAAAAVDPENKLLWRYPRRRLEAEAIRDSMLFVSGVLDETMGGPGVFPTAPKGTEIQEGRHWKKSRGAVDEYRRSVYTFNRRLVRYPMLEAFDAPLAFESCGRRQETVTPDQALELMNGTPAATFAKALAARVANDQGLDDSALVDRAFRFALTRSPQPVERERSLAFLAKQEKLAGSKQAALTDLCLSLLSTNEFLYIE
jgi:hypothetical protein